MMRILPFCVLVVVLLSHHVTADGVRTLETKLKSLRTCLQVCTEACMVGYSCQTDANGCKKCLPTPTAHCTSNEGNPVAPGSSFRVRCNACGCKEDGTVGICTLIACDTSKCWDDQGNSYGQGQTITNGCKTGTCTQDANGQGVWDWQDQDCPTPTPSCPQVCTELCRVGYSCQTDANGCKKCLPTPTPTPSCPQVCTELCRVGESCQTDANGCKKCLPTPTTPSCPQVCTELCRVGYSCQTDANGCKKCLPTPTPTPSCPQVCTELCRVGYSCQTDANGCKKCLPTPTPCTSNEGNPVLPGSSFRVRCNACGCKEDDTVGICTHMACDSHKCWDDQGNRYDAGQTITRATTNGCKTGTCTQDANGVGVWVWQDCPTCTSNEGNPVAPGSGFRVRCNACGCNEDGTVGICTQIACDTSKCWDDQGNSYDQGQTITNGCKIGTCTQDANGVGVWDWSAC